ncbi:2-oxoisovalerate dehydrogenase E2 component (dihydrolipoyl transacylase) [Amphibacillus marinus]|uniref:Dihydrolipoamide acetyltransferase component of pyruvate dehydrogenase complex n=1 Tax=Amphibacillus marinus TaxID=872970 RepID=A0A1H8NJT0_9BACI|nr:dihydrolipoamide acetyltransferase family protein [Amphibacillus marinus]SEO29870.1 2-oxoisovalerate dehydrogenase E2 component (dihydrolipoyl transacylase) [Amphibacillus marinus]
MSEITITMPQLGESVTEGTVSQWLVQAGDLIEKYQPLVEVMTDKVNAEVPATFSGEITALLVEEGETIAVGTPICQLKVEGTDDLSESTQTPSENNEKAIDEAAATESMKQRYSPAVLTLAAEHHINLADVTGTGMGGRITRKDIKQLLANQDSTTASAASQQLSETSTRKPHEKKLKPIQVDQLPGDLEIPVTGIRKAIASNMVRATSEIPHAWMMIEVDVTNLVSYRNAEKKRFKELEGYNLSYFSFFLNAVAKALKKFPELNSSWAGDKIIQHKEINLSIAVGSETELYVPVIRNVDEKSIKGIAKDVHHLAKKARTGSLTQADMQGGTFTVNNTGTFGSVQSMGVINYPQAAILQVESIVKRPVIINDMFAARDMVNLCLSLDHRILDGVICGKFMSHVRDILENISGDTTPIY